MGSLSGSMLDKVMRLSAFESLGAQWSIGNAEFSSQQ
jgi:hypothetical protein